MQKAEKISSKFSNCAITRQRKPNGFDARKRNSVPLGFCVCECVSVSAHKLNECRAAFCLVAVFLWCVLNHRIFSTHTSHSTTLSIKRVEAIQAQAFRVVLKLCHRIVHKHTFTYDFLQYMNQQFGHFVCHV